MAPLQDFSNNIFSNRSDFRKACIALLRKLQPYQSTGGARIRLPLATGTHFDDVAAQLEGYARPLWAVASLIHGGDLSDEEFRSFIEPYVRGLANGTDPKHPEYWGPVILRDQRMVEMEIISFALLTAPDVMYHHQEPHAQRNIKEWLNTLNGKDFPTTNWLWFRVMTNLALVKVCGIPYAVLKEAMDSDLEAMEQFYLGEGWAADGIWNESGRQADYYSGSFAIQFSQLLFIKFAEGLDPARCGTFRDRAAAFAVSFWRYFDSNGAAIPFGRSLTYRFAFAGFWSAVAFADVHLPSPLNDSGAVKGLLLRHFRWWSDRHDMFNIDGTLTIGFSYPNMYMCEDYNSPQSPYWAMKSFVALGLPGSHSFWQSEEKQLPQANSELTAVMRSPSQIICNTGSHHYLLSNSQFCPWPLKATEAKYCKSAYSSHFGFSVPTGSSVMAQIAPDSTLALSKDEGETWRLPWKTLNNSIGTSSLVLAGAGVIEEMPTLSSIWRPWKDAEVAVSTTIIAPCNRWLDWHIRLYKFENHGDRPFPLRATAGGFSIQGRGAKVGEVLPAFNDPADMFKTSSVLCPEGTVEHVESSLIGSDAGISGLRALAMESQEPPGVLKPVGKILKPDANTNLLWQRTLIPTLEYQFNLLPDNTPLYFAVGVFAIANVPKGKMRPEAKDIMSRWENSPNVMLSGTKMKNGEYYIIPSETEY